MQKYFGSKNSNHQITNFRFFLSNYKKLNSFIMSKILTVVFVFCLNFISFGQYFSLSFQSGYSSLNEKIVNNVTVPNKTISIINVNNTGSQTKAGTVITHKAEAMPLAIRLGYSGWDERIEMGVMYQGYLDKPKFHYPFTNSENLSHFYQYSLNSAGVFFKGIIGGNDYEGDFNVFISLDAGRRFGTKSQIFSDLSKFNNPTLNDKTIKLLPSFYIGTEIGLGYYITDKIVIDVSGRYLPIDYYEEIDKVNKVKMQTIQGLLGIKFLFGRDWCGC